MRESAINDSEIEIRSKERDNGKREEGKPPSL